MARERYLVGVTPEELEYTPAPAAPMSPRNWLSNFWYHNSWTVIIVSFVVVVAAVLIWQSATKENPDFRICMACSSAVPDEAVMILEEELEQYATDINGDGKVIVQIQMLDINSQLVVGQSTLAANNRQAVVLQLSTRDTMIFALDPAYYESLSTNLAKGTPLLAPLPGADPAGDGTYFVWDIAPLLPEHLQEFACDPLYVGARSWDESLSQEERQRTEQAVAFLQSYLESTKEN